MESIALLKFLGTEERQFTDRQTGEIKTTRTICCLDGVESRKFSATTEEQVATFNVIKQTCKPMSNILVKLTINNYYIAETQKGGISVKIAELLSELPALYTPYVPAKK